MATGEIQLPADAWFAADGSSGNAAPEPQWLVGSQSNPVSRDRVWAFDQTTIEYVHRSGLFIPANWASGGSLIISWQTSVTSGAVVWAARVRCVTAGDADTPFEHAWSTEATVTSNANTTEANRLTQATITLNMDSPAIGDDFNLLLYRKASDGSDTAAADALLRSADFQYTTT